MLKCYVIVTGLIFGLLLVAHVARFIAEGAYLLREPIFILTTFASGAVFIWAVVLFGKLSRSGST